MKKIVLTKLIKMIKKNKPNLSSDDTEIILYGLEGLYITITKTIVILLISYVLGLLVETLLLMLAYNVLRTVAFGLHATKSIYCYISSITFFIGGAFLTTVFHLNIYIKLLLSVICIICLYKYAPADTYKRPLINAKKRMIYKTLSVITGMIYTILIIIYNNNIISNYLLISMMIECILIHPFVYNIFKLPYNNYKTYLMEN